MTDPQIRQARSRVRAALGWLAPSVVAGCAGAVCAGLVDGTALPFGSAAGPVHTPAVDGANAASVTGALATAGFVALFAMPGLAVASAIVRGVIAAWQPGAIARALVDEDGAAPRLAGWVAVAGLAACGLGFAMFQSVWLLFNYTAFKALTLSFAQPIAAIATACVILALSRPCARLFAWLAQRLDARWRGRGHATLLRPRRILVVAGVTGLAVLGALWLLAMKPRLGPVDTSVLHAPAAGLAAAGAVHLAWSRLGRARLAVGLGCAAATVAVLAVAGVTVATRPSLTLELWGERPLAGLAIDALFDLEEIRGRVSLAELRPDARPGAAHPDIVMITIDTVRADHTPPYGGQAEMPALRELAERGAVFDWAFSPSNVTRRSIPSMITGLAPNRVRGRVVGWALRVDPRHVLLAERMRAGGYDTAGFMCCEGFWGPQFRTGLERGLAHVEIERHGGKLAGMARTWLDARERRPGQPPLFLWMHILEPHNWTQVSGEPRSEADRRLFYDRSLTASDRMVQEVLAAFAGRAPDRKPIVIVTADHGEALGEHGQPFHSTDLYNAQIRVPLVIAGPGIKLARIGETISLTDLTPSVLDLAGFVPPAASFDGRSFADLATGARVGDPDGGTAFAAMIKDRSNPGGITAVVKGRWKLVNSNGNLELYDVRRDPGEHDNVAIQHPRELDELRKLLDAHVAAGVSAFR